MEIWSMMFMINLFEKFKLQVSRNTRVDDLCFLTCVLVSLNWLGFFFPKNPDNKLLKVPHLLVVHQLYDNKKKQSAAEKTCIVTCKKVSKLRTQIL